jgi:lon-related putative ATP-dependent protease
LKKLLKPASLRWRVSDTRLIEKVLSDPELKKGGHPLKVGQARARTALEIGLGISERGFNIFVVGGAGTGRTSMTRQLLNARAKEQKTPPDIVLLYNFDDRDSPLAVEVPAGQGPTVRKRYEGLVDQLLMDLEKAFDADHYVAQRQAIEDRHRMAQDQILGEVEAEAAQSGFLLSRAAASITLTPSGPDGKPITEETYEALGPEDRQNLEAEAERLENLLEDQLRKIRTLERETDLSVEALAKSTADKVVAPLISRVQKECEALDRVVAHLEKMHEDVLNRLRRLVPQSHGEEHEQGPDNQAPHPSLPRRLREEEEDTDADEPALLRYRVNVLVTRKPGSGAPVVEEVHPTTSNLIGRIEYRGRGGEMTTDHTRIRAGALYKANGGFLIIEAQELLREPAAWEGLKRALKNRHVVLDDPGEPGRMVTQASMRPEALPLSIKVCLIGNAHLYYGLTNGDPDFAKLFKVKADFDLEMARTSKSIRSVLRFVVRVADEENLRPLDISGASAVLEQAARIAHHQKKLTCRFGDIADLIREANFWAGRQGRDHVAGEDIRQALKARAEREGFAEARLREDIESGRVMIELQGAVEGQCNALTVIDMGNYSFGMPARITCRTGVGTGEIIDIERESELGGSIHSKGTLILRGLLSDRFGQGGPLCLNATLCFEQSYVEIDGDSASLAEACALFSVLSGVPIKQNFALTGSIDQRGNVQAIGGVNEKIEGFFRVCEACDPKRPHSVIIPASNAQELMLEPDLIKAAQAGRFSVHTVTRMEEAIELLTGVPWKGKEGIRARAMKTLREYRHIQRSFLNEAPEEKPSGNSAVVRARAAKSRCARLRSGSEMDHAAPV